MKLSIAGVDVSYPMNPGAIARQAGIVSRGGAPSYEEAFFAEYSSANSLLSGEKIEVDWNGDSVSVLPEDEAAQ